MNNENQTTQETQEPEKDDQKNSTPWYQEWWAYGAGSFILLMLIYFFFFNNSNNKKEKKEVVKQEQTAPTLVDTCKSEVVYINVNNDEEILAAADRIKKRYEANKIADKLYGKEECKSTHQKTRVEVRVKYIKVPTPAPTVPGPKCPAPAPDLRPAPTPQQNGGVNRPTGIEIKSPDGQDWKIFPVSQEGFNQGLEYLPGLVERQNQRNEEIGDTRRLSLQTAIQGYKARYPQFAN